MIRWNNFNEFKMKGKGAKWRKKSDTGLKLQLHLYNAIIVYIFMGWAELGFLCWMAGESVPSVWKTNTLCNGKKYQ